MMSDSTESYIEKLEARIRVMDLVHSRLPKSDDGFAVVMGDTVWVPSSGIWANGDPVVANEKTFVLFRNGAWEFEEDVVPYRGDVYFEFEAAEAAKEKQG